MTKLLDAGINGRTSAIALSLVGCVLAAVVGYAAGQHTAAEDPDWATFEMADLLEQQQQSGRSYLRFFNNTQLNTGVYVLKQGAVDNQNPHTQDEVYYVLSGKAAIQMGSGDEQVSRPIQPGSVIFIKAGVEHRFHKIDEDLKLLVFFATKK